MGKLHQLHLRGIVKCFFISLIYMFLSCQNSSILNHSSSNFSISEQPEIITVCAEEYQFTIDKKHAILQLNNPSQKNYTTFPLDIRFTEPLVTDSVNFSREWKIKGKQIVSDLLNRDTVIQKVLISCSKQNFEIQFLSILPVNAQTGVYFFRNNQHGFDTKNWNEHFSAEPDNYFNPKPMIDVRADRDQQWKFAPAPLNLSFQSAAGWFSTGLATLPDATVFSFRDNALWVDYPVQIINSFEKDLYLFSPIVFTFSESPWEAIADYSNYVYRKINQKRKSLQAGWWQQPLLSTKGEQRLKNISPADSTFHLGWVEEYVDQQIERYDHTNFTFILETGWNDKKGDPTPSPLFKDLRSFIDNCHQKGVKVVLTWNAWKTEKSSLVTSLKMNDGDFCDATHSLFTEYVDSCCQIMFGDAADQLDADGILIDELYAVRRPENVTYQNPHKSMGIKEIYLYLSTFHQVAKKYKKDALIISSAIGPHFYPVQDMVNINTDWDNKTRREKRARIILQSMPGMLVNSGATEMYNKIAPYHYTTAFFYGIPAIHYLNEFRDGEITKQNQACLKNIIEFVPLKPEGDVVFREYGTWQIVDQDKNIAAETLPGGKGILIYNDKNGAQLLCTDGDSPHLILERHNLKAVYNSQKKSIPYVEIGNGIYKLTGAQKGQRYRLQLEKIRMPLPE